MLVDDVAFEAESDEPDAHSVTFVVEDVYGNTVDHAVITMGETTNASGDYYFEHVASGTHEYSITAFCFEDVSGELFINDDLIVEITLGHVPGDANGDCLISVLDVIAITNYFIGITPDEFCFLNADVNEDGVVNILDIIATVDLFANK